MNTIWVTFRKEGIHKYPAALTDPKLATGDEYDVSFLGYPHRHIFHFKVWIEVFHDDRDIELAKCNTILNIHGFFHIPSNIFEHIRCDRLLEAGFNILSETSYKLDELFVNKYPNLKQINYEDFFNVDVYPSNNYRSSDIQPKIID